MGGSADTSVAVVGLGYVGLPLAREASRVGLRVVGIDIDQAVVAGLQRGVSHVDDISDGDITDMLADGFTVTSDGSDLARVDVVTISVPTPLADQGRPDLSMVMTAGGLIAEQLKPGQLVILESTSYPGTTEEVLLPQLERSGLKAGVDFHLAFSPERIDPGNSEFGLVNTPKIVGGLTEACAKRAANFYSQFVREVVIAKGTREAEMSKLLENTYRHVNIALVNELARLCHELDIDLWDAIRCAGTKPFGFQAFTPGPGVGGHCIPIDPNYLSHHVRTNLGRQFRLVELAQEINVEMPPYVVNRAGALLNVHGKPMNGARILLMGVTYKPGIADQRQSPAVDVARLLADLGAKVVYHDPLVVTWQVNGIHTERMTNLDEAMADVDLVILLQAHGDYLRLNPYRGKTPVLDTRGVLSGPSVETL